MAELDRYIPGVPCWVDTSQPDPDGGGRVLRRAVRLGDRGRDAPGRAGQVLHGATGRRRRRRGRLAAWRARPPAVWNTYVWVESADDAAAKVREAGGRVLIRAVRRLRLRPDGVLRRPRGRGVLRLAAGSHRGATVVNEHGSLNFNGLNTRDPERAKAFYGAVFGWSCSPWAHVGAARLRRPPREAQPGHARADGRDGAPEGFEDVVASLIPIPDDQPDTPAHWSVTFAVDDADAIAQRATELGGTVLVPPVDAPWVRMTVIRDPQGATFTANKFVPENRDLGVWTADSAATAS